MNGDNENWTVAWRLVFKFILSLRQFSGQDGQSGREGQITEIRESKWLEIVVVRWRAKKMGWKERG